MFPRILPLLLLTSALYLTSTIAYKYEKGPVPIGVRSACPGKYCGRSPLNSTHVGGCGACPRGWRVANNSYSLCERCVEPPGKNQWMFLAFHLITALVLHWGVIDYNVKRRAFTKEILALHASALLEVVLAAIITLLISEPMGSFSLASCPINQVSDWYSLFHNPRPNYEEKLHCTQEVVYPFYTIIFKFYGLCILFLMILRPLLSSKLLPRRGRSAFYAALWFLPILAFIHAIFGGVIYIAFPFIVLILSIVSCAAHFAFKLNQSVKSLFLGCFTDSRNLVILLGHWCLHAFALLGITQWENPVVDLSLLSLVPLPAIFYIATSVFTEPNTINGDMNYVLFPPASPPS